MKVIENFMLFFTLMSIGFRWMFSIQDHFDNPTPEARPILGDAFVVGFYSLIFVWCVSKISLTWDGEVTENVAVSIAMLVILDVALIVYIRDARRSFRRLAHEKEHPSD